MDNPFVSEEIVYTIMLVNGAKITGRFYDSALKSSFWNMTVNNEAGWIEVNPNHIATIQKNAILAALARDEERRSA